MVAFCIDCIDHLDSFFWHLAKLVPSSVSVVLFSWMLVLLALQVGTTSVGVQGSAGCVP
jgi:hypothetical protein